jgi:putative methyltransferase (TIGR04325 family)
MEIKTAIKNIPIIDKIYLYVAKKRHRKRFANNAYGAFSGIFSTVEQAIASAPKTKPIGYNYQELAQEYVQMFEENNWENSGRLLADYDYPVLFWLSQISQTNKDISVFDFGGNIGIHCYVYSDYISCIKAWQWQVCEVPEIVKAGRMVSKQKGYNSLSFTNEFADIKGKDVFIASGSIQYVANLSRQLTSTFKPKHILINRLPLYEGEDFVTLQNGGKVYYPQYVFNKHKFIKSFSEIGYKMIDLWRDNNDGCTIPFHPDNSLPFYYGLYLRLEE